MVTTREQIERNLRAVRNRIAAAARRAGRPTDAVTLVAVTKYADLDAVQTLVELGVVDLGESRPQQIWERAQQIDHSVRWHLVGSLQRNKARRTLPLVTMIHSVDSLRLLGYLDQLAREMQLQPRVLIEVNLSGESTKHGFDREALIRGWDEVLSLEHLRVDGLMTMAVWESDPERTRPTFAALRQLRDRLRGRSPQGVALAHLSMGMSSDFEIAVEEGATLVRVGSALFAQERIGE
jgi:hypothetical protein